MIITYRMNRVDRTELMETLRSVADIVNTLAQLLPKEEILDYHSQPFLSDSPRNMGRMLAFHVN